MFDFEASFFRVLDQESERMSVDLYKILGVSPDAGPDEIKKSYRRLAMKYHPDQNPGDTVAEERFKEVAHAYEVVSDPQKRRAYDRLRRTGGSGEMGQGFESFSELFELLNTVLSAGLGVTRASTKTRGDDLKVEISLSLEEVFTGVRRDVTVARLRDCDRCRASGAEPGTELRVCMRCGGDGEVRIQQGFFSLMRECKECRGRGRVPQSPCRRCGGTGLIEGSEILPVDVPPGVRDGQTLRWTGKGRPGKDGQAPGDLLVSISVMRHRDYEREGQDLHFVKPITFTEASLGARIEVPTLHGNVVMKVPPGTSTGRVFRLRRKGLPAIGNEPQGDQYVRLEVMSPEEVRRKQEEDDEDVRAKGKAIWRKVKDIFR